MKLLVGLGNPGKDYDGTRHNVGFRVIDGLVDAYGLMGPKDKYQGQLYSGTIGDTKVLALKPQTFMNKSGVSVQGVANFYKIPPENIIVFYDELDLPVGKLRVKQNGGSGGHNGIKSVDAHAGKNYHRVRIGIDHPGHPDRVSSYVLKPFAKTEVNTIDTLLQYVVQHTPELLADRPDGFMNKVALAMQPDAKK